MQQRRILIVDDESGLRELVRINLEHEGFAVLQAENGVQGVMMTQEHQPDLVIMDLMMPEMDGWEACRKLREFSQVPVLMLTARVQSQDIVTGLDSGADDYLIKPFALAELTARLRALTRRGSGRSNPTIVHGTLTLDPAAHQVHRDGCEVALSPREFSLLELMLEKRGHVLSKAQLESALYGWGEEVESNSVEVHIHHLRRKLGSELIRTLRGVGYMIPRPDGGH